jgi:hypothetical protein
VLGCDPGLAQDTTFWARLVEEQGSWAGSGRKPVREGSPFSFSFQIFQSKSSKDFEILFEFSNRAHNTKYYATA